MNEPTIVHRCPTCHRMSGEYHVPGCPLRGDGSVIPHPVPLEIVDLTDQPTPPTDAWMWPGSDEHQWSLIAAGALWAMFSDRFDNEITVRRMNSNTMEISFHRHTLAGKRYTLTIEQVRPEPDDGEPF